MAHVEYTLSDDICTIRLNRPEKLNAMTPEMWTGVTQSIAQAADDDARVIVLTGVGRAFCAGDDIGTLAEIDDEYDVRRLADVVLGCFSAVESSPLPVIGKANGSAYGGGFELLISTDLAVVPQGTTFSLPETRIGAYPFYGAKRLARLIGRQRAMDIAIAGRELSAQEAVDWGLFARAVPGDEVDSVVADIISNLKQASPGAIDVTKRWLNAGLSFPGEDHGMRTGLGYLFSGDDAHEGATAFLENRDPTYAE